MTAEQLTLPVCVLPGCRNPVAAVGEPCTDCLKSFGPHLRESSEPALTPEQITERDNGIHHAYALQHLAASLPQKEADQIASAHPKERKQNQICWLCERRRSCTREQMGWECDDCREVR